MARLSTAVVVATTKVGIFKQITTPSCIYPFIPQLLLLPQRQEFSSKSQPYMIMAFHLSVVVATTKVGIFKQITTVFFIFVLGVALLLLPQRQEFSSKSQLRSYLSYMIMGCCCYHKGRNFQANHNIVLYWIFLKTVVVATTKVGIFKQITTAALACRYRCRLLLLPQRQEFSSKSQLIFVCLILIAGCCCYHKGRNFQANHNFRMMWLPL